MAVDPILRRSLALACCVLFLAAGAAAAQVSWADWETYDLSSDTPFATGSLFSGAVGVEYSGPLSGPLYTFAELNGSSYFEYPIYDVPNRPIPGDMLGLNPAGTHTLTFGTSLVDPLIALISLGRPDLPVSYIFDTPDFTIISEGQGAWGDGSLIRSGSVLTGYEGHGVIQFSGTFSSISWESTPNEYWHGITVGAASTVPEPTTLLLLASGLLAIGWMGIRRQQA